MRLGRWRRVIGSGRFILDGRTDTIVCPFSLSVECYARVAASAVAQRISSLADGDLFRTVGGEDEAAGYPRFHVVFALGVVAFPGLDRPGAARGAQTAVRPRTEEAGGMVFGLVGAKSFQ